VITGLRGVVLLDSNDAAYIAEALARFFSVLTEHGSRPSQQLAEAQAKLRKAAASASDSRTDASGCVRIVGGQQGSLHAGEYDLVDSVQAARILGCTAANVRDLGRRGRLPAHRAGGRWLYPASAVVSRAEEQAAKRG
jgi:hypothetical protein